MAKHVARYSVHYGLQGCYMPDSHYGCFELTTRRELSSLVREALASYDMPKSAFASVNLRTLWRWIKAHGSSVAHFTINHGEHNALTFSGITEAEYTEAMAQDD